MITLDKKLSRDRAIYCCDKGHSYERARRNPFPPCPQCRFTKKMLSYQKIINDHTTENLHIQIEESIGNNLYIKCSKGHVFSRAMDSWMNKKNFHCTTCRKMKVLDESIDRDLFPTVEIKGTSIDLVCVNGHKRARKDFTGQTFTRCAKCESIKAAEKRWPSFKVKHPEKFVSTEKPIDFVCINGHTVKRKISNMYNYMCTKCAKGHKSTRAWHIEKLLYLYYIKYNIHYTTEFFQKIDNDNRYYDFEIAGKIIIEYDGSQHYKKFDNSKYLFDFDEIKKRDVKKEIHAQKIGYKLYRFKYTDSLDSIHRKLNNILSDELNVSIEYIDPEDVIAFQLSHGLKVEEIAKYYKNHTGVETARKFNVGLSTPTRCYRTYFGHDKGLSGTTHL